jgi:hypothetical protein
MKPPPLPTLLLLLLACGAARAASPPRHAPSPSHDAEGRGGDTPLECRVATPALTVCASSGSVLVNERARYTVEVPAGRSLACELVPVGRGDADLEVAPPAGGSARAKASREVRSGAACGGEGRGGRGGRAASGPTSLFPPDNKMGGAPLSPR